MEWETQTVKTDYDEQGQVTKEYTPRGTQTVETIYDIQGNKVRQFIDKSIYYLYAVQFVVYVAI